MCQKPVPADEDADKRKDKVAVFRALALQLQREVADRTFTPSEVLQREGREER